MGIVEDRFLYNGLAAFYGPDGDVAFFFHGIEIDHLFTDNIHILQFIGPDQETVDVQHDAVLVHDHDAQQRIVPYLAICRGENRLQIEVFIAHRSSLSDRCIDSFCDTVIVTDFLFMT